MWSHFAAAMYMYDRSRTHQQQSSFMSHTGSFNNEMIEEEHDDVEDQLKDSSSGTNLLRQNLSAEQHGKFNQLCVLIAIKFCI